MDITVSMGLDSPYSTWRRCPSWSPRSSPEAWRFVYCNDITANWVLAAGLVITYLAWENQVSACVTQASWSRPA